MSTDAKRLTPQDPVAKDELEKIGELENSRFRLGAQLLDLEQDRVRLLRAAQEVDRQRDRVYEKVMIDRGINPNLQIEIDANTGEVLVVDGKPAPEAK